MAEATHSNTPNDTGDLSEIEVVVFDVLGTLVDEPGGLRAALREAVPTADDATVEELRTAWQQHVESAQAHIAEGQLPYANSALLDTAAAQHVADLAGVTDPTVLARLAKAGERLPPWPDAAAGLDRLARHLPVLGLSNAGHTALLRLNAHAALRWHQALSAETVRAYKPAPEVYQLALDVAGCPPERALMVAAHAWDLRAAQTLGMRTAYIRRPATDPPTPTDAFDRHFDGLDALVDAMAARGAG